MSSMFKQCIGQQLIFSNLLTFKLIQLNTANIFFQTAFLKMNLSSRSNSRQETSQAGTQNSASTRYWCAAHKTQFVLILPDTGIGSSSSSSGGGGPGGVLGPLGCGLGGLPLNWSSFSPSTAFIVKTKTCT